MLSPEVRLIPLEVGIRGRPEATNAAIGPFVLHRPTMQHLGRSRFSNVLLFGLVQTLYGETVDEARLVGKEVKIPFQVGSQLGALRQCMFQHGRKAKAFLDETKLFCGRYPEDFSSQH